MYNFEDIIAAVSTPVGNGGIGIIRLSGAGCIDTADKLFKGQKNTLKEAKSHTMSFGNIIEGDNIIDTVLVSIMREPNSYTKEDVVEINCHGGQIVLEKVLGLCLKNGARLAEPGEFTKRAFLNGRIDLSQAEAVNDIINSKTDLGRQASINQLNGSLKNKVKNLREQVLDMVASIEAAIDYPEHDIEEETYSEMYDKTQKLMEEIDNLISTCDTGKIIRDGIITVILGKPNVGKSSLLNKLLKEERAIVTDIPGTTRDTLEEYLNLDGIPVKLIDTAGIRKTEDKVEKIGVNKSREYALKADLILLVLDCSKPIMAEDYELLSLIKDKKAIIILNKMDLEEKIDLIKVYEYAEKSNIIKISASEGKGVDLIGGKIRELFLNSEIKISNDTIISNVRHKDALIKARDSLKRVINTIESKMPEDFISLDLQDTMIFLGEITGDAIDEEIIDRIFTKFCLGK